MPNVVRHDRITKIQSGHTDQHVLKRDPDASRLLLGIDAACFARQFRGDRVNGNVADEIL